MGIAFRAHHFLCSLCFQGNGYSNLFVENYASIMEYLNSVGANEPINIVNHTDDICSPCPHKQGHACATQLTVAALDEQHQKELGFVPGDTLTWTQAKKRLRKELTLEKFHRICAQCNWKHYGICESVIKQFLGKSD